MDGKNARLVTFDTAEVRQIDHGYAVTSHSSQGLTAGRVLANFDTDSHRNLINTRLAYVAISRASHDARIYTNDAERLGEKLASSISKTSALEVHSPIPSVPKRTPEIRRIQDISIEIPGLSL